MRSRRGDLESLGSLEPSLPLPENKRIKKRESRHLKRINKKERFAAKVLLNVLVFVIIAFLCSLHWLKEGSPRPKEFPSVVLLIVGLLIIILIPVFSLDVDHQEEIRPNKSLLLLLAITLELGVVLIVLFIQLNLKGSLYITVVLLLGSFGGLLFIFVLCYLLHPKIFVDEKRDQNSAYLIPFVYSLIGLGVLIFIFPLVPIFYALLLSTTTIALGFFSLSHLQMFLSGDHEYLQKPRTSESMTAAFYLFVQILSLPITTCFLGGVLIGGIFFHCFNSRNTQNPFLGCHTGIEELFPLPVPFEPKEASVYLIKAKEYRRLLNPHNSRFFIFEH